MKKVQIKFDEDVLARADRLAATRGKGYPTEIDIDP